ncbi:MAG: alpha-L-fucosidase, partial [Roseburia sp.]|nr:alpha-L-fucosidase [Roseburia sp.]
MYDMKPYLKTIDEVIARGPFDATWESLMQFEPPKWYRNAKFGIFIHWGVYSVPAYDNEWYPRNMYIQGSKAYEHHIKTYGPQKDFGYKDFIPMFKAEKFDAKKWVKLFEEAGAKYVVPVA